MEGYLAGFDLPVLLINFVADQDNGDILADPCQILVPFRDVFVGDSGGDIKHEDGSMGSNVISFPQPTEFFLSCGIPDGQFDRSMVGMKDNGADFYSLGGNISLLELTSDVPLHEGSLAHSSITDENNLELCDILGFLHREMFYVHFQLCNCEYYKFSNKKFPIIPYL